MCSAYKPICLHLVFFVMLPSVVFVKITSISGNSLNHLIPVVRQLTQTPGERVEIFHTLLALRTALINERVQQSL